MGCSGYHLKHRFIELNHVVFWAGQKAENVFPGPGDPLKYRFLDLAQVAFWAGQMAENEFKGPGDPFKRRFHDFAQSHFWTARRHKMCTQSLGTSLSGPRPSRILVGPGGRK
jgi:hypothetical protein